jgi:hypothetical protein
MNLDLRIDTFSGFQHRVLAVAPLPHCCCGGGPRPKLGINPASIAVGAETPSRGDKEQQARHRRRRVPCPYQLAEALSA